jgi:hypothetical protein
LKQAFRNSLLPAVLLIALAGLEPCRAQNMPDMPGMHHMHDMPGMHMTQMNPAGMFLMNQASGTSLNPQSWPMPMFMPALGSWNLMLMGQAFLVDAQQTGPRGADKFYSTNWFMAGAEHSAGKGSFMFDLMLSLEPATITKRFYPELFQTGETAYGRTIVDGQHPHNFIMGLGFHYARPFGEHATLHLYFAPVGDPALGPVAYPHRASAAELPEAPLGHHWQDSTHIADDVVTAGVKYRWLQLEASGFHGAEPGENRWTITQGAIDSWSTRLSVMPSKNWIAQVSVGRLAHPERQEPGDVVRATASLEYSRPMAHGEAWSSTIAWGRNHDTLTHRDLSSFLAESVAPIPGNNFVTGRVELVDKDELFTNDPDLEAQLDRTAGPAFRIGAYTAGLTHDLPRIVRGLENGIGANITAYSLPQAIKPFYGTHPFAVNVYLRLRLKPAKQ